MNAYRSLEALGDSTRRQIFEQLGDGPVSVRDLAERFPISRPAVSQHLKVLKDAGLVRSERDGSRHLYQMEPEALEALRSYFDHFWNQTLGSYKAAVEKHEKETRDEQSD